MGASTPIAIPFTLDLPLYQFVKPGTYTSQFRARYTLENVEGEFEVKQNKHPSTQNRTGACRATANRSTIKLWRVILKLFFSF